MYNPGINKFIPYVYHVRVDYLSMVTEGLIYGIYIESHPSDFCTHFKYKSLQSRIITKRDYLKALQQYLRI